MHAGVTAPDPWRIPVGDGQLQGGTWPADADDAPVVLALHGLGANHRWWVLVAQGLARRVTLLAPDLPGHGRSSTLPAPTLDDQVAVLETLLTAQLPLTSPLLLAGHGTGALLAVHLAARLTTRPGPRQVDGVVRVAAPEQRLEIETAAEVALDRVGRTYAHRRDDLAWWRARPGLGHGLSRAARWAVEADVVGSGFAWTVLGDRDMLTRDASSWIQVVQTPDQSAVGWPQVNVTVDDAKAVGAARGIPERGALAGPTLLLRERGAAATVAAIRSLLPR